VRGQPIGEELRLNPRWAFLWRIKRVKICNVQKKYRKMVLNTDPQAIAEGIKMRENVKKY
jgi:hypothetical protein